MRQLEYTLSLRIHRFYATAQPVLKIGNGRSDSGVDLSTGIYIVQLRADGRLFTGKSMLIR